MANEHKIKNILLNYDQGVYMVGQMDQYGVQGLLLWGLDNKINILDMAFYYRKLDDIKSNYTSSNYPNAGDNWLGTLQNGYTSETASDVVRAKNWCKDVVIWLWGSLEKGGFGLFRRNYSDTYYGSIYSTGKYTDGTKTYYNVLSMWASFEPSYTPNCAFVYLYYGTPGNNTGSYFQNIAIIKSRSQSEILKAYNGQYDGSVNMRYLYDTLNPVTSHSVDDVITSASNNWIAESIGAEQQVAVFALERNASFTNYNIYDDERNEIPNRIHVSGHWYGDEVSEDENNEDGGNGGQGGGGANDDTNNPVGKTTPTQFTNDAFGTGFIQAYNPTKSELLSLANILCTGVSKNISLMLKKLFTNPLDYIVALNMCHFSVSSSTAETVKLGGWDTGIGMNVIEKQYYFLDGGSVEIKPDHGNFLDYSPYTRCKIFVPYCGIHELPVDLVMSGTLSIQYIVDTLTGAMVAELYLSRDRKGILRNVEQAQTDGYMWSFSGNCFTPIPIGNLDYRNAINSILGLVSGVGTTIATGNPMPIAGAVANGVMNSKPDFQMGSNIGSNFGYMTAQTAFIILQNTVQNRPYNFIDWKGYPSNTLKPISSYSGYLECDTNTFWCGGYSTELSKPITETEADEIKSILNSGVWV